MSNLYIMRHGKTEWNAEGRLQGRLNSPLLNQSKEDLITIADKLKENNISKIYVSPLQRCIETADIICGILNLDYEKNEMLAECNLGDCEGMKLDDVKKQMPDFYESREKDKWNIPWPNGESYYDVYNRAENFLKNAKFNDNTLIISHEMFNKVLAGCLLKWDEEKIIGTKQANTDIFHIDMKSRDIRILRYLNI